MSPQLVPFIHDEPQPFGNRSIVATTDTEGNHDVRLHSDGTHLWVTWVDSDLEVALDVLQGTRTHVHAPLLAPDAPRRSSEGVNPPSDDLHVGDAVVDAASVREEVAHRWVNEKPVRFHLSRACVVGKLSPARSSAKQAVCCNSTVK